MTPRRMLLGFALVGLLVPLARADQGAAPGPVPVDRVEDPRAMPRDVLDKVGFDQKVDTLLPLGLKFRDDEGDEVALGDYFHKERPVIVVLAYYRCRKICNRVLVSLLEALKNVKYEAGPDFKVVVVSFDPAEKPEMAAAKKEEIKQLHGRRLGADGWAFLTGDEAQIKELTDTIGFRYVYDAAGDEFHHPSGIVICTPEGKTSRYMLGAYYKQRADFRPNPLDRRNPDELRLDKLALELSLTEASQGKIGSALDQITLLCMTYDPASGKYTLAVWRLMQGACILTALLVAAYVFWPRRKSAPAPAEPLQT